MGMKTREIDYMVRCFELARRGARWTTPNPIVGCLIVKDGRIVGEGYHPAFGGPHAEVVALKQAGRKAKGATLYVNLEPCVHRGKTPPCTDAIIGAGIRTVVAAIADPNPLVAGRGFRILRKSGITVKTGLLRTEARLLNERFLWFMEKGRPFVGVKLAQTLDGRIADRTGQSRWISSIPARVYAHELRARYHAVMVGAETVRQDNPDLTVRHVRGRQPVRIVLDGSFTAPVNRNVFRTSRAQTIVLTSLRRMQANRKKTVMLERKGVQVLGIDGPPRLKAEVILKVLAGLGITSVLIEGGGTTIGGFLEEKLVDRLHGIIAPLVLGSGKTGLDLNGQTLRTPIRLVERTVSRIGDDVVIEGRVEFP